MSKSTRSTAAIYLACGIDPLKVCICFISFFGLTCLCFVNFLPEASISVQASVFVQSHIRAHIELMWLLSSMTPISWLNRMIQFKEKSRKEVFSCLSIPSIFKITWIIAVLWKYNRRWWIIILTSEICYDIFWIIWNNYSCFVLWLLS